jgi:UDP-glucose 4-epimerase
VKPSPFLHQRILITGGAGFIGSNLALRLVEEGADVTIIDSLVPEYGGNLFNLKPVEDRIRINISDVRDRFSFAQLVKDQDYLFNLAGQTSHLDSMEDPFTDLEINCRAQLSILEVCRQVNPGIKILFASTRQLYGRPAFLPVTERHLLNPADINGIHKMAGEAYHILYHQVYGLRSCSLRLTNTIGPRMRIKDARQTFVGAWIRSLLENKPFEVWGGEQLRDLNDVEDVIDALLLCAASNKADGKIFNLGSRPPVRLRELADLMISIKPEGRYLIKEYPPERSKIDIGDYYGAFDEIHSTLGWQPRVSLKDSVEKTLRYFQSNLSHYL